MASKDKDDDITVGWPLTATPQPPAATPDIPVAYVPAATPPWNYNNTPAGMDARDRGGALPNSPYGYTYNPTGDYKLPETKPPATKDYKTLPKTDDKGANIVSPANSGGGSPPSGRVSAMSSGGNSGGGGTPARPPTPQGPPPIVGPRWTAQQEAAYLEANPDVAAGIAAGTMDSGQGHYQRHGQSEGRRLANAATTNVNQVAQANAATAAANARMQAELDAMKATAAREADIKKQTADRQAAISGITPSIAGVGAGGEQIVRLNGLQAGMTLSEDDIRGIASKAGYGVEAVRLAAKNAGVNIGTWSPTASAPTATAPQDSFDEAGYLAQNPDVAAAVAAGTYKSGREHWEKLGRNEVRPGGRQFTQKELDERAAWPNPANPSPANPNPASPPAANPPVATPSRGPSPFPLTPPPADTIRQGDRNPNNPNEIWDAQTGKYVPFVAPTGPLPPAFTPVTPTVNTGTNAVSNEVSAARFIETLPGGSNEWEYEPIGNVVVNVRTGDSRQVPSASLP